MFCRSCASVLIEDCVNCSSCSLHPLLGTKFCNKCCKKTSELEVLCYKCGTDLTKKGELAAEYENIRAYKKIYRSGDEKVIFGFLAGISHKYNLQKNYIRVCLILITLVAGYFSILILLTYFLSRYLPVLPTKGIKKKSEVVVAC